MLAYDIVPLLYNALDVVIVPAKDNAFGRYCFPQKLYEILACKRPLVAARVGAIERVLKDYPDMLYDTDDSDDLYSALQRQLHNPRVPNIRAPDWSTAAERLDSLISAIQ